jgi:hypothetical protein
MRFTHSAVGLLVVFCACSPMGSGGTGGGSAGGSTAGGAGGGSAQGPTWYKDVLPVAQARCMSCHRTGGIGAFSMESADTAIAHAAQMDTDVTSRKMPPWPADDSCGGPYVGSLHLTDTEIATFHDWVAAGAPAGNPADAPPAYQAQPGLSHVDLTGAPANPYTPPSGVTDDYHCFIVDPGLSADQNVIAYEIDPGVTQEVHHVALYVVDRAQARAMDPNGTGWTCFGAAGTQDEGLLGAWAPGARAVTFPAGTGLSLPASKVVVMQVHYNLQNGVRAPDTTTVKLQFATGAVIPATMQWLIDSGFSVPPNAMGYQHQRTFTMPSGRVWGVFGHMHTQGHVITLKSSSNDCFLNIPNWDFHWQEQFFYQTPKQLTAGETLTLQCTWNNTTPNMLRFGENTSDEMCIAVLYITP